MARFGTFHTYIIIEEVILLYRYRLPPWLNRCVCILERAILPILIFQLLRTLFLTTTLDLILLCILIVIFIIFYLEWL